MIIDRLSIRVRITAGTLVLAAAFFGGAAILVHRQVESVLDRAASAVLDADATPFQVAIRDEPNEPLDRPGEDQLIAVVDPSGAVVLSTLPKSLASEFDRVRLDTYAPQQVRTKGSTYVVRVDTQRNAAGIWHVVAARSETASTLVLDSLTRGLIWGLVALTVIFGAASWFLTGAALRPISRLRRSAEALVGSTGTEFLPESGARDEVHDLARTLNTLIEQLRQSAEREKQLVSDASHELRTPLAILQGRLELLRTSPGTPSAVDIVDAERAAARMGDLVANLLELSRLEGAEKPGSATIAQLRAELVEAVDRARFVARATAIEVEYDTGGSGDGAASVAVSAIEFGRIVDNLATNAIRAMGVQGRVALTLSVRAEGLILAVTDTGPGMPEDFLERAFDRFSQRDEGRSGGSGLGLSIVAAAARRAGGSADLANESGGFRATVVLPVVRPAA